MVHIELYYIASYCIFCVLNFSFSNYEKPYTNVYQKNGNLFFRVIGCSFILTLRF